MVVEHDFTYMIFISIGKNHISVIDITVISLPIMYQLMPIFRQYMTENKKGKKCKNWLIQKIFDCLHDKRCFSDTTIFITKIN